MDLYFDSQKTNRGENERMFLDNILKAKKLNQFFYFINCKYELALKIFQDFR